MMSGINIGGENFDFEQISEAARRIHGYHMFRAFYNYHYYLVSNIERWHKLDLLDQDFFPKIKTIDGFFYDPKFFTALSVWYLYLFFSHNWAEKQLDANPKNVEIEQLLYLRSFGSMNVSDAGGVAGLELDAPDIPFRSYLEKSFGEKMQIIRIISPADHYTDTVSLMSLVEEKGFGYIKSYTANLDSIGLYSNTTNWKEQVRRLVEHADRIVIFLSSPTPSVLWELAEIRHQQKAKNCLIVIPSENDEKEWRTTESDEPKEALGEKIWTEYKKLQEDISNIDVFAERYNDFNILCSDDYEKDFALELTKVERSTKRKSNGRVAMSFDVRGASPDEEIESLERFKLFMYQSCRASFGEKAGIFPPWIANWIQHTFLASIITQDHETCAKCMAFLAGIMRFYAFVFNRYFIETDNEKSTPEIINACNHIEHTDKICTHLAMILLQLSTEYETAEAIVHDERDYSFNGLLSVFEKDLDDLYGR